MTLITSKIRARIIATTIGLLAAAPAQATSPFHLPVDATLDQLIAESLRFGHEITAAEAGIRAQQARVPQAAAMPDPVLQFGVQNDGFNRWQVGEMETSFYSIVASQTVPWPGKRALRSEIAELGVERNRSVVERLKLGTEAEVRRDYLALLVVRGRLELTDRLALLWRQSTDAARVLAESGSGAQTDILRSQLEQTRLRQRRVALVAEERRLTHDLNRLRNHDFNEVIPSAAHLVDLGAPAAYDEDAAVAFTLEHSPELRAARSAAAAGERAIDLARTSFFPDLTVSAGVMPRGGDLEPMWLLSIGGPVPLFAASKQSRALEESAARAVASRVDEEHIEHLLRLRVRERLTALAAQVETIEIFRGGLLIQSRATAESTLTQYRVGKVGFSSMLSAIAGTLADEDGYLQALAAAHQILIAAAELSLQPVAGVADTAMGPATMPEQATTSGAPLAANAGAPDGATNDTAAPMAGGM